MYSRVSCLLRLSGARMSVISSSCELTFRWFRPGISFLSTNWLVSRRRDRPSHPNQFLPLSPLLFSTRYSLEKKLVIIVSSERRRGRVSHSYYLRPQQSILSSQKKHYYSCKTDSLKEHVYYEIRVETTGVFTFRFVSSPSMRPFIWLDRADFCKQTRDRARRCEFIKSPNWFPVVNGFFFFFLIRKKRATRFSSSRDIICRRGASSMGRARNQGEQTSRPNGRRETERIKEQIKIQRAREGNSLSL